MNIIDNNLYFGKNYELQDIKNINMIVYHHSGVTTLQDVNVIHNYHKNKGYAGIGYHFYVRKDGKIYKGRSLSMVGAHAYTHNRNSIGICAEGDFDKEEMNVNQLQALKELTKYLKKEVPSIKIFKRHKDLNSTSCPGKNFPLDAILRDDEVYANNYQVGKVYTLQVDLYVREKPTTNSRIKAYRELTKDGKKHAYKQTNAVLKKSTRVTCQSISENDEGIWLKIPSGFICANYRGRIYVS